MCLKKWKKASIVEVQKVGENLMRWDESEEVVRIKPFQVLYPKSYGNLDYDMTRFMFWKDLLDFSVESESICI